MNENILQLVDYAKSMYWTPYIWGGNHPNQVGVDCSGEARQILMAGGVIPGVKDYTAQALRDEFAWVPCEPKAGAFAFYGQNDKAIRHIAFCITDFLCIEAGGGDERTQTKWAAAAIGACVRLRPIKKRQDFIDTLWPPYLFEA